MATEIDREQLQELLTKDDVVLIEVLPEEEYARLHIKGAINIPIERIGRDSRQRFTTEQRLVVYCSDIECPTSGMAAQKLAAFGFTNVFEYAAGKQDWEQAGLPLETGGAPEATDGAAAATTEEATKL